MYFQWYVMLLSTANSPYWLSCISFIYVSYVKLIGDTSQMIVNCLLTVFSVDSIIRRDYGRVGSHLESNLKTLEFILV